MQVDVSTFPMGPGVAKLLGFENISPNIELKNIEPARIAFSNLFLEGITDFQPKNSDEIVNIVEELVGMDFPFLAIKFSDVFSPDVSEDFRFQFQLGNACMMVGETLKAQDHFAAAQKLIPEEPAPYINMAQIFLSENCIEDASKWVQAGLDVEKDNTRLWELFALILQDNPDVKNLAERLKEEALRRSSWAGLSLSADFLYPDQPEQKLAELEKIYVAGEKSDEFLVEFTGVLGICGQYDRILTLLLWGAGPSSGMHAARPWRLLAHGAQACLALERVDQAREFLQNALKCDDLSSEGEAALREMEKDVLN